MKYPKQIIIPKFLYEPSIQQRINEMKTQDDIDNNAHYTNKQYKEFAIKEYLANHNDYIKLAKDIHKTNLKQIKILLNEYEELLNKLANLDNTEINNKKIEKSLNYINYLQKQYETN